MKKRLLSVVLTLVMLFSLIPIVPAIQVGATTTINIGDYVQMGKYYDEPILWRCVDIDENGPLMLADRILTIKPFDAMGKHTYLDGTPQADNAENTRTIIGSNLWETSSLRSWLNSTLAAGKVKWLDGCVPTADNSYNRKNAYADEQGFLSIDNFAISELNSIKSVTQKSLLNELDVAKLRTGGNAIYKQNSDISYVVQNYDTAYYQNVNDKMFLLDVLQINRVYQNKLVLGADYYIGKPTQKAVDKSEFKNSELAADKNWHSFLRSPSTTPDLSSYLCTVYPDGAIADCLKAKNYVLGVRPAFYIDQKTATFTSGTGKLGSPFIVSTGETPSSSTLSSVTTSSATKPSSNISSISASETSSGETSANSSSITATTSNDTPKSNSNNALLFIIIALLLIGAGIFVAMNYLKKKNHGKETDGFINYKKKGGRNPETGKAIKMPKSKQQADDIVNEISKHTGVEKK